MTSPLGPEAFSFWRQNCLLSSSCWLRLGDTRPGPRQNFSLLRLNHRWTSCLPYAAADLRRLSSWLTGIIFILTAVIIIIAIVIVRPLFKWNIYLSLLCDWIFLYLQNHFSFLLQIVQLKCVIFLYFCAMYVKLTQCPVSHAQLCALSSLATHISGPNASAPGGGGGGG